MTMIETALDFTLFESMINDYALVGININSGTMWPEEGY